MYLIATPAYTQIGTLACSQLIQQENFILTKKINELIVFSFKCFMSIMEIIKSVQKRNATDISINISGTKRRTRFYFTTMERREQDLSIHINNILVR